MNSKLTLVFSAIVAAAVAGEMVPPDAPAKPSGSCVPSLDLCTGPAVLGGKETQLTYVCPETSELLTPSTVHVTVTATTTVTVSGAFPVELTASVRPIATPAQPGPVPEPDTTTTIHTTSTKLKTITLTHKLSSSTTVSAVFPPMTEPDSIETLITATSMFEFPTPAFPRPSLTSSSSSSAKFNATDGFTLLPIPTPSRRTSSLWIPSDLPPIVTGVPSGTVSLPHFPSKTKSWPSNSWDLWGPSGAPTGHYSALPKPHHPTGLPSGHPIPPQPTHSWQFPPLRQIREVNATATVSALPTHKTGGAGQMGVSVAALFGGVMVAAYLF